VYDCETYLMFPSFHGGIGGPDLVLENKLRNFLVLTVPPRLHFLSTVSTPPVSLNLIYLRKKNVCDYQIDVYYFSLSITF